MKRLWILIGIIFLAGCLVRTHTIEKPRVDMDLSAGNRGYLVGSPPPPSDEDRSMTRKVRYLEIEFGSHAPDEIIGLDEPQGPQEMEMVETIEPYFIEEVAPSEYEYYTVQKNDTLQKISDKFYGTTRKWKKVYEANADVLKGPNKIFPGQKIKIPRLD